MDKGGNVSDNFEMKNRYPGYDEMDYDQLESEHFNIITQDDGSYEPERLAYVEDLITKRRLERDEYAFVVKR